MGTGVNLILATAAYACTWGETIFANATAGAFAVTLPAPSIWLDAITVKNIGTANAVTVTRSGTALVNGATTYVLSVGQSVTLVPDGANWQVVAAVAGATLPPDTPTIGAATAGNAQATVGYTAAGTGSAATSFTATSTPGAITGTAASGPITVTGLTNGTAYTFTVHATNAGGNSAESAVSNSVTPSTTPTAPGAPTIGTATAGNTTATANWTAPASDGGSAITGYEVKTYDSAGTLLFTDTVGVVLTFLRTGLTNGTAVKFKVAAINAIGTGVQSAFSNTVTPATAGASDTFTRANENPLGTSSGGQVWTHPNTGKFQLVTNKAVATGAAGSEPMSYVETGLSDFTLTIDIVAFSQECQAVFRVVDNANFWRCMNYSGGLYLVELVAGTSTNYGGFPAAPASGNFTMRVVCLGTSIKTYIDSGVGFVLKHDIANSTHQTATKAGLGSGNGAADSTTTYDNFLVVP